MATIDMGRKEAGVLPLSRGQLCPRLTQCGLGRVILPYQVAYSSIQPFGHNRHGPKTGWGQGPFFLWELGFHRTPSRLGRAYHKSKWHLSPSSPLATTDIGRKLGGCAPLAEGEVGPHLTQCRLGRGLPPYQVAS